MILLSVCERLFYQELRSECSRHPLQKWFLVPNFVKSVDWGDHFTWYNFQNILVRRPLICLYFQFSSFHFGFTWITYFWPSKVLENMWRKTEDNTKYSYNLSKTFFNRTSIRIVVLAVNNDFNAAYGYIN